MRRAAALALAVLLAFAAACTSGTSSGSTPTATAPLVTPSAAAASPQATLALVPAPRHTCAPPYPSGPPTAATVFCANPAVMQRAAVLRIVDGDTIHVELQGRDETIRFYGIDTTERGQPCSAEATERTRQLVGIEVLLVPDARDRDRYGRLLRYVYTPGGLSVDAEMVDEGLAHAWREDGALRFPIIALEDAARARHEGCLWRQ